MLIQELDMLLCCCCALCRTKNTSVAAACLLAWLLALAVDYLMLLQTVSSASAVEEGEEEGTKGILVQEILVMDYYTQALSALQMTVAASHDLFLFFLFLLLQLLSLLEWLSVLYPHQLELERQT